ncbi:MAG: class II aldolase/adducin family protein [Gloeobacteraceae cyanobacterium ES-bin-144]|nr:class II aldolase/adducin family protein [Verrucomicrobiales bacterium]
MNFELLHPRDQIVATMERIYGHDMTTTSGGNISIRDENGDVWITPARVDKGALRASDIVRIKPDGTRDGIYPASSECPFHLSIYKARPDVKAIIHAHPGALVSFSICGQVPNTRLFPEAWNICGKVAFAPYALPGSARLGANIAEQFASKAKPDCVLMENHGIVVGGADLATAFARFETLEFTAQTLIAARQLGDVRYLDDAQLALAPVTSKVLPSAEPQLPTSREKELRKEICDFVHRAYAHRLMTSTWGSFSARIADDCFVVTPTYKDRSTLTVEDLVVVRGGKCVQGQFPSRVVGLHRAIYQAHPEINAVVNALPIHATAFSVSKAALDTRTIPESYLFLKDVAKFPFEQLITDVPGIAAAVGPKSPIALLGHNGALVAGRTVLDAFDRLEVLEATATAIIRGLLLGPINPMSDAVIEELLEAFPSV